jgi:hypothetical protein
MSRKERRGAEFWLNEFCEQGGTILCASHGALPISGYDIEFKMVDGCLVERERISK